MSRAAALALCGVVTGAAVMALAGARPYAGSWNDGSRFATAESLVDEHTWTIDRSIFVQPWARATGAPAPYPASDRLLTERGTLDRLLIDGRFVTDKAFISTLLLAAEYWLLQKVTGIVARNSADRFCYWLTVLSSGVSFVIASAATFVLAQQIFGSVPMAALLGVSFSISTVSMAYSRHVNAHVTLLAVFAVLMWRVHAAAREPTAVTTRDGLVIGTLAGLAYGVDAALGPLALLLAIALCGVIARRRTWLVVCAAAPWVIANHALNYTIAHTLMPPNSVAEYLLWPGTPFDARSISGQYSHESVGRAALYGVDLLIGRRGFLVHNLPVLFVPIAAWQLMRTRSASGAHPAVVFAVALCVGGWLIYTVGSTNRSGVALSIRWFVPLLAPASYLVMRYLHEWPSNWPAFTVLSAAGAGLGISAWLGGPWQPRVPLLWWWVAAGITGAAVMRYRWRRVRAR